LRSERQRRRCRRERERSAKQITYPGTGNRTEFLYDGFGNRVTIAEFENGSMTLSKQFFGWEQRNNSGQVIAQYFPQGFVTGDDRHFYSTDSLGSIRHVADENGLIEASYVYDPYGRRERRAGTFDSHFQYASYYMHERSGLSLTGTRPYDAGLGRFISRDPIAELSGTNLYGYVGNDPASFVDPSGLLKLKGGCSINVGGFTPPPAFNGPPIGPHSPGPPVLPTPGDGGSPGFGPPIYVPGSSGIPSWHLGPVGQSLAHMSSDESAEYGFYVAMAMLGGTLATGGVLLGTAGSRPESIGFQPRQLVRKFQKHGGKFNSANPWEYQQQAVKIYYDANTRWVKVPNPKDGDEVWGYLNGKILRIRVKGLQFVSLY
jgi:RHS repeat-associated protein